MISEKIAFHTLGCKVNTYETEAVKELFERAGYEVVDFEEKADIYVVNTCSVTNIADRKSRQMLHKAKQINNDAIVIAMGCYVQSGKDTLLKDGLIDIIVGNDMKSALVDIVKAYKAGDKKNSYIDDIMTKKVYEPLRITKTAETCRAFIKVCDGCNMYCSYCIIPYTRGPVRSRALEDCVAEVEKLAASGFKEVVLSGIHVSSYGLDLKSGYRLIDLIETIEKIDGIERIRLGSFEPRMVDDDFLARLSKCKKVCPHFHLSLQSGCDETLKRMKRHYDTKRFMEIASNIRASIPDAMLTTDVIVGFPGETDEEFKETVKFLEDVKFFEMHVFKYSRRSGTVADKMPDQIDGKTKNERSEVLIKLDEKNHEDYYREYEGRTMKVLIEEECVVKGEKYVVGHTDNYIKVYIKSDRYLINQIVDVKLVKAYDKRSMLGVL